jgi:hypothetical protein
MSIYGTVLAGIAQQRTAAGSHESLTLELSHFFRLIDEVLKFSSGRRGGAVSQYFIRWRPSGPAEIRQRCTHLLPSLLRVENYEHITYYQINFHSNWFISHRLNECAQRKLQ